MLQHSLKPLALEIVNTKTWDAMTDFHRLKAMIVDPSSYNRSLLREILLSLGVLDCTSTLSCAQARSGLQKNHRDLIFLDEEAGDTVAFARALRRDANGRNSAIPIFLVSAGPHEEQIVLARDAGINGVIVRPLSAAAVERKLRLVLEPPKPWISTADYVGPDRRCIDRAI
jgi:CheY-like chemotaxis protein